MTHDWYFYNFLFLLGYKARFIKNVITYYRLHESSLSFSRYKNSLELFKKSVSVQIKLYESLIKKLKELNYKQNEYLQPIENHIMSLKIKKSKPNIFSDQLNLENYLWWGLK